MTEGERHRPVVEADAAVVGELVQADERARETRQQLGRAEDAVASVWAPVRQVERDMDAALARLHALNEAEVSRADWLEAQEQHRDAVRRQVADRAASRGRGPAARSARDRLAGSTYDVAAARERASELGERAQACAERTGNPDSASWRELREAATATIASLPQRRDEALAQVEARMPAVTLRAAEARDAAARAAAVAEDAARRAAERGLDVDRIREQAARGGEGRSVEPSDAATEAAISRWEERGDDVER